MALDHSECGYLSRKPRRRGAAVHGGAETFREIGLREPGFYIFPSEVCKTDSDLTEVFSDFASPFAMTSAAVL